MRTTHVRRDAGHAGREAEWATDTNTSPHTRGEATKDMGATEAAGIEPAAAPRSKRC